VACTTELAGGDLVHGDLVCTGTHFKTQFGMAYPAFKANPMKPVGEYHWIHTGVIRIFIQYYVCVLGLAKVRDKKK
jgi:hypothetical protein